MSKLYYTSLLKELRKIFQHVDEAEQYQIQCIANAIINKLKAMEKFRQSLLLYKLILYTPYVSEETLLNDLTLSLKKNGVELIRQDIQNINYIEDIGGYLITFNSAYKRMQIYALNEELHKQQFKYYMSEPLTGERKQFLKSLKGRIVTVNGDFYTKEWIDNKWVKQYIEFVYPIKF